MCFNYVWHKKTFPEGSGSVRKALRTRGEQEVAGHEGLSAMALSRTSAGGCRRLNHTCRFTACFSSEINDKASAVVVVVVVVGCKGSPKVQPH